jgi:hypothetical protein
VQCLLYRGVASGLGSTRSGSASSRLVMTGPTSSHTIRKPATAPRRGRLYFRKASSYSPVVYLLWYSACSSMVCIAVSLGGWWWKVKPPRGQEIASASIFVHHARFLQRPPTCPVAQHHAFEHMHFRPANRWHRHFRSAYTPLDPSDAVSQTRGQNGIVTSFWAENR